MSQSDKRDQELAKRLRRLFDTHSDTRANPDILAAANLLAVSHVTATGETPRADAVILGDWEFWPTENGKGCDKTDYDALATLARQLERELAEMTITATRQYHEGHARGMENQAARSSIAPTDAVRDALIDLVRLKDLKQWIESVIPDRWTGHKPAHWERIQQYEREKEPAWEAARLALESAPSATAPLVQVGWAKLVTWNGDLFAHDIIETARGSNDFHKHALYVRDPAHVPTDGGAKE